MGEGKERGKKDSRFVLPMTAYLPRLASRKTRRANSKGATKSQPLFCYFLVASNKVDLWP